MSDHEDDDIEIGECGICHETKELVATIKAKLTTKTGQDVSPSVDVDACEACVRKLTEEMMSRAGVKIEIETEGD